MGEGRFDTFEVWHRKEEEPAPRRPETRRAPVSPSLVTMRTIFSKVPSTGKSL